MMTNRIPEGVRGLNPPKKIHTNANEILGSEKSSEQYLGSGYRYRREGRRMTAMEWLKEQKEQTERAIKTYENCVKVLMAQLGAICNAIEQMEE